MHHLLKTTLLGLLSILLFVSSVDPVPDIKIWNKMPYDIEIGETHVLDIRKYGYCSSVFDPKDSSSLCKSFTIRKRCLALLTEDGYVRSLNFCDFCLKNRGTEWNELNIKFATSRKEGTSKEDFMNLLRKQGVRKVKVIDKKSRSEILFKVGKLHYHAFFNTKKDDSIIACNVDSKIEYVKVGLNMLFVSNEKTSRYKLMRNYPASE